MVKKCPYCKDENSVSILYKGNGNKDKSISVECTSHNSQDVEQWKPNLYKCELCKLVFSEFIGVDFASKYVDVIDQSYIDQIEFKKKTFNLFFKKIEKHLNKDIKVLEIGSYYGVLGSLIKPHVKEYVGIELSNHATDYSREIFGLDVICELPEEYLKKNNKYDLIIMSDVIEHLDRPFEVLSLIEKNLNVGGKLILSTFNFDSFFSKVMGRRYPWIIPMHKYYFSNITIKNVLKKYNLFLFDIQNDVRLISAEYLLQKLNILFFPIKFIFNYLLKFELIKKSTIKINLYDLKIYYAYKK